MNNFLKDIPASWRLWLYITYGVAALIVGALVAFYQVTPDTPLPDWLSGVGRVIQYLAIPFAALAGSNVPEKETPTPPAHLAR